MESHASMDNRGCTCAAPDAGTPKRSGAAKLMRASHLQQQVGLGVRLVGGEDLGGLANLRGQRGVKPVLVVAHRQLVVLGRTAQRAQQLRAARTARAASQRAFVRVRCWGVSPLLAVGHCVQPCAQDAHGCTAAWHRWVPRQSFMHRQDLYRTISVNLEARHTPTPPE